jgi:hypothetical protein
MNTLKKLVVAATMSVLILAGSGQLNAQGPGYGSDCEGCGYEQACCAPSISPAIVVGAIAIAAIIAVAVQNDPSGHHHHHHSHGHFH